jgi:hypothetical protein
MRGVAAQDRVRGQSASEAAQLLKNFVGTGVTPDQHGAIVLHKLNLIALLQPELAHELRGQTNSEGIPPFCNLHVNLPPLGYTFCHVHHCRAEIKACNASLRNAVSSGDRGRVQPASQWQPFPATDHRAFARPATGRACTIGHLPVASRLEACRIGRLDISGRGTGLQAGDKARGSARQGALHVPRGCVGQGKPDTGQALGRASALRHVIG